MKINVEVDLDWFNEESEVDDQIKERVITKIAEQVVTGISSNYKATIADLAKNKIDEQINKMMNDFLEQGFTPVDSWGDPKGKEVKIKQLLKDKLSKFLEEKVDGYGKVNNYNNGTPRYQHILNETSKKQIDTFLNNISKEVISGIKHDINEEAKNRVVKSILSDYSLKDLIN